MAWHCNHTIDPVYLSWNRRSSNSLSSPNATTPYFLTASALYAPIAHEEACEGALSRADSAPSISGFSDWFVSDPDSSDSSSSSSSDSHVSYFSSEYSDSGHEREKVPLLGRTLRTKDREEKGAEEKQTLFRLAQSRPRPLGRYTVIKYRGFRPRHNCASHSALCSTGSENEKPQNEKNEPGREKFPSLEHLLDNETLVNSNIRYRLRPATRAREETLTKVKNSRVEKGRPGLGFGG